MNSELPQPFSEAANPLGMRQYLRRVFFSHGVRNSFDRIGEGFPAGIKVPIEIASDGRTVGFMTRRVPARRFGRDRALLLRETKKKSPLPR